MAIHKICLLFVLFFLQSGIVFAQTHAGNGEEGEELPVKIMHAEPLYIDLIRDLGARKGEREWNVGMGMTDNLAYDSYEVLVEYEFAPINRLGVEFEVPVKFYTPNIRTEFKPANRIESFKSAVQYTFLVQKKARLSAAIGYLNELEMQSFNKLGKSSTFTGYVVNPFLVVAKRLGQDFHTLVYTGPQLTYHFADRTWDKLYELNTNFHYMIPSSRNFVGLELNKQFTQGEFNMVIRPQMRLSIADNLLVGIVPGVPISRQYERLSFFMRLIYEPRHRH
jgi:hypothetical protein